MTLAWVGAPDRRAETEALDRETLVKRVALTVLNQRLTDRAMKPGAPFVGAQAGYISSLLHSGSLTTLSMSATPEKWRDALESVSEEQRMLLRDGVQPGELQRAVTNSDHPVPGQGRVVVDAEVARPRRSDCQCSGQ